LRFTSLSSGDAQDMYVLALVTQKGGSGKSTLAVGLAVAAMENGERVAFVEADPQGTISKWKERRGNPYPRVVRVADSAEIDGALSRLEAEGIWLGIIDTAATNNALAMRAIARADLLPDPGASEPGRHRSCHTERSSLFAGSTADLPSSSIRRHRAGAD
jgi:chromosome partitioning protein